jgi:hypothetical protein
MSRLALRLVLIGIVIGVVIGPVIEVVSGGVIGGATLAQAPARDRVVRPGSPDTSDTSNTSDRGSPIAGTAAVHGRVTGLVTGDAVRHARISLTSTSVLIPATLTDEEGRFSFAALAPGGYVLTVSKPGYVKQTTALALKRGAAMDGIEVALTKAAVISGLLTDDFGDPAIDANVVVQRAAADNTVGRRGAAAVAQTDDLGAYRVTGLSAGTYIVSTSPGVRLLVSGEQITGTMYFGGGRGRFYYPGVTDPAGAQPIVVRAGDERAGISFTVPGRSNGPAAQPPRVDPSSSSPLRVDPASASARDVKTTAVVRGRVLRADGGPLPSAQVIAAPFGVQRPPAGTSTGADGSYELTVTNVAAGDRFRITAFKPGYQSADYGQRNASTRGDPIGIEPGETEERTDIMLQRLAGIAGRILDDLGEPVEGVSVRAATLRYVNGRRQLVDAGQARQTDDLGRYRLFGLRPGQYAISATVGQIVGMEMSAELPGYGTTYFPGTPNPPEIQFVRIGSGQDVTGIDFSLSRMKSLRVAGHALDAAGDPITGGIALMPSQRSGSNTQVQMGARIDPDGAFEFPNVPPGDYVLQVVHGRSNGNEGEFAYQFVTLTDRDVTDLEIQSSTGSTLTGHITSDGGDGPKLDGVELSAIPTDLDRSPRFGGPPARARVAPDGSFELDGISGPRRLQVVRMPAGWTTKTILVHGVDVTDQPQPFGREDQSADDIEVVLTSHVTRIAGSVSGIGSATGSLSSADVAVFAFATDRESWYQGSRYRRRVAPAATGTFAIEGLPPGDYYVVASEAPQDPGEWQDPAVLEKLAASASRVRLADGQQVSVSLRPLSR